MESRWVMATGWMIGMTEKGHERTLWDDGNTLYNRCGRYTLDVFVKNHYTVQSVVNLCKLHLNEHWPPPKKKGNPGQNANYHLSITHSLCILTWVGCDSGWWELRGRDRWEERWLWRKKTEEKRCAWPGFKELTLQRMTAGLLWAKLGRKGQTPNQYPKGGPAPLRIPACQCHLFYRAIPGPWCLTPESVKSSLHLPSKVSCVRVSLTIRSPSPGKTAHLTSKHAPSEYSAHTGWMDDSMCRETKWNTQQWGYYCMKTGMPRV